MKTRLIIVTTILFILVSAALTQGSDEACASHERVYARGRVAIWNESNVGSVLVKYATSGTPLTIIGSKRVLGLCWLQVSEGWLINNAILLASTPREADLVRADPADGDCYEGDRAFTSGPMNIRADATTDSFVVATARPGQSYQVTASRQGAKWCWLKIAPGWLANTSRVHSTEPAPAAATRSIASQQSDPPPKTDIDNCCFVDRQCRSDAEWEAGYWAYQRNECPAPAPSLEPAAPTRPRIEGSASFIRFLEATLDLLEARSTQYYRYVVGQTNLIVEGDPYGPGSCGAHVNVLARRVTVDTHCQSFNFSYTANLINMAGILWHESCHVYHHDHGITYPEGQLREEWECSMVPVIRALDPYQRYFQNLRRMPFEELVARTQRRQGA